MKPTKSQIKEQLQQVKQQVKLGEKDVAEALGNEWMRLMELAEKGNLKPLNPNTLAGGYTCSLEDVARIKLWTETTGAFKEPGEPAPPPMSIPEEAKNKAKADEERFIGEKSKPYEICRSGKFEIRSLRQVISSIHSTVQHFQVMSANGKDRLISMIDVSREYAGIIKELDAFYAKASGGIGEVTFYLVAEARGFTKKMKVSITEEDDAAPST